MNEAQPGNETTSRIAATAELDEACDRFESAWQAGNRPSLADFLAGLPDAIRPRAFRELLNIELSYRGKLGDAISAEEYRALLPDYESVIGEVFRELALGSQAERNAARDISSQGHDRNLLFGILALQMEFISRDALVAAMNAWVLEKSKSLGQILVDLGRLPADSFQLLDALVQKHVALHGNDPQQSLAAVSSLSDAVLDLRGIADSDVQASLQGVANRRKVSPDCTGTFTVGTATSAGTRFRILRPHAEGALGMVSVARDEELSREVALKEIKTRHADQPESRSRFLLEAEVTGGLEHPNIIPVYGLGQYADGRPFYVMRFIRGDNLKDACLRFHASAELKRDPVQRALEFRKLLRRFVDVCNAIEYAHNRGVLHRDLKPGNIMLGKYGETLVVDWGLSKVMSRSESSPESSEGPIVPSSGSGSAATQMGSAIGTPAFMSPEQAAGRLDQLGPASDVYSLGATLYYLLTNRPPFQGNDIGAVLQQVQRGEFAAPRKVDSGISAGLEAICVKAMSLKPTDRYASSRALADDIERWLADEPVAAYRDPLLSRIARVARRHKVAAATVSALLLAAVVGLSLGTLLLGREQARTEAKRREAVDNFAQADAARRDAEAAADVARRNFELALNTLKTVIFDIQHKLINVPAAQEVQRGLLATAMTGLEKLANASPDQHDARVDRDTATALFDLGDLFLQVGDENGRHGAEMAHGLYERAFAICQRLAKDDPKNTQAQQDLSYSYERLGDVSLTLGDAAAARKYHEQGLEIRRRLAKDDPKNAKAQRSLSVSYEKMGDVSLTLGDAAAARRHYEQGLEISQRLAKDDAKNAVAQRDLSVSCEKLGDASATLGDAAAARKYYEQGLEIRRRLAKVDPKNAVAQRDLSISYERLGDVSRTLGDAAAARKYYGQYMEISQRLAKDDPKNAQAQRNLSISYNKLGDVSLALGDAAAARKYYEQVLEISQRLAKDDPKNADVQRDLSVSHDRLGAASLTLGDAAAARKYFEQSLDISLRLAKGDAKNAKAQRDLFTSYYCLAQVESELADFAKAKQWFQKAQDQVDVMIKNGQLKEPSNEAAQMRKALADCEDALEKAGNKQTDGKSDGTPSMPGKTRQVQQPAAPAATR